jgi:hypothetical protein
MAANRPEESGIRHASTSSSGSSRPHVERTGSDRWLVTHETVVTELVPLPGSAEDAEPGKKPARKPRSGGQQRKSSSRTLK